MGSKKLLPGLLAPLLVLVPLWTAGAEDEAKPAADPARIAQLIEELGADEFPLREKASRALIAIGEAARPALQEAMKSSENMETRWRSEQILKRLDRQRARPLDAPPAPSAGSPGEVRPPGATVGPETRLDEMERRLAEMMRRMGIDESRSRGGLFGPNLRRDTLKAEGLELEIDRFGFHANLVLRVTQEGKGPATYRGRSLEALLEKNPDLAHHPSMPSLQKQWGEYKRMHPTLFAFDDMFGRGHGGGMGGGISVSSSGQGYSIRQDANGTTVVITEKNEQGETVKKTYTGESLEAIQKEHPELKEKLPSVSMRFGPIQGFGPGHGWRRPPSRSKPPVVTPRETEVPFGVQLSTPDPVLASHLKLDRNAALLVTHVLPGSQAADLGVKNGDIIVGINDDPLPGPDLSRELLRRSAATKAPLALDVIRQGERMRLVRQ